MSKAYSRTNAEHGEDSRTLGKKRVSHQQCKTSLKRSPPPLQTVYEEMEVDTEMQNGLLPGALALSAKFLPTMKGVARQSAASVQRWISERPAHSEVRARRDQIVVNPGRHFLLNAEQWQAQR